MKILLDNGHGFDTPGKRSPDGHFREYAYNRYLSFLIKERLTALGLDARGWSCFTTRGKTKADELATSLYEAAKNHLPGMKLRTDFTDGDPDIEKDFYIIRHTSCPAVLSENLFMDNREDVAFLESEEGARTIVNLHVDGILQYLSKS